MPTNNAWNISWLNKNSQRNYPISEGVSRSDTTGSIKLPNDLIVDLSWTYTNDLDASYFHILSVTHEIDSIVIVLGYDNVVAGRATISINSFKPNSSYLLAGTSDHYDSVGTIVIGSLDTIIERLPSGKITFDRANCKLESSTMRQLSRGVSTISVVNELFSITGDVIINTGINLRIDTEVSGTTTYLILNAVSDNGLIADCVECDDPINDDNIITTINGIRPDNNGNIDIIGDTCLQIQPLPTGLQFSELCSQPCCGCDELAVIKNDFEFTRLAVDSVNTVSGKLAGELSALSLNLASSQTDDIPTAVTPMVDIMQALLDEALSMTDCNPPC